MIHRSLVLTLFLVGALPLAAPGAASGQAVEQPTGAEWRPAVRSEDRVPEMMGLGVVAGATGLAAGWALGSQVLGSDGAALLLAGAGVSFGVPCGVQWGSGGRGDRVLATLAAAGIGLVGVVFVASQWTDDAALAAGIAVPVSQLVASLVIEAGTSQRSSP